MTLETPIDFAHAAADAEPDRVELRLRLYERILDAELFLLLESDAGDAVVPRAFDVEAGRFVAAFDRDDRLAAFLDAPAPYAALPGRRLAALVAARGLGIALNPGVAPSEILLPAETVDWLAAAAAPGGELAAARPRRVGPPNGAPEALVAALAAKLPALAGLAADAWLARVAYDDGSERLALAFVGAPAGAEADMAAAVAEAARFSGVAEAEIDALFVGDGSALAGALARNGLRFEPPRSEPPKNEAPRPPGSDPDRPPILR